MLRDARPLGSGFWPLQQRNWVIFGEEELCAQLRGGCLAQREGKQSYEAACPGESSGLQIAACPLASLLLNAGYFM